MGVARTVHERTGAVLCVSSDTSNSRHTSWVERGHERADIGRKIGRFVKPLFETAGALHIDDLTRAYNDSYDCDVSTNSARQYLRNYDTARKGLSVPGIAKLKSAGFRTLQNPEETLTIDSLGGLDFVEHEGLRVFPKLGAATGLGGIEIYLPAKQASLLAELVRAGGSDKPLTADGLESLDIPGGQISVYISRLRGELVEIGYTVSNQKSKKPEYRLERLAKA